jgi:hypothetical protein
MGGLALTKNDASAAAASIVSELKKSNAKVEGGQRVPASEYRALQQKLTRQIQTLSRLSR